MRPRDLLAFAQMHLDGGKAADGTRVLSGESVAAMQQRQVELPYLGLMGDAWGLGWEQFDWSGGPVIGHDGSTIGQNAFLRIVPGRNVAVALLTNGGNPFPLYTEIFGRILRELADVEMPALPTPPAEPGDFDAERYLGTYASEVAELTVSRDEDGKVWLEQRPVGALAELVGHVERRELVHLAGDTLIPATPTHGIYMPCAFVGDDGTGHALYLHSGRATRRGLDA